MIYFVGAMVSIALVLAVGAHLRLDRNEKEFVKFIKWLNSHADGVAKN